MESRKTQLERDFLLLAFGTNDENINKKRYMMIFLKKKQCKYFYRKFFKILKKYKNKIDIATEKHKK